MKALVFGVFCIFSLSGCGGAKDAQCKFYKEVSAIAVHSAGSDDLLRSDAGKKTCETLFRSGYAQKGIDFQLQKIYRDSVAWPDRQTFILISSSFAQDRTDPDAKSIQAASCTTNLTGNAFLRHSFILASPQNYNNYLKDDSMISTDPQIQKELLLKKIRSTEGYKACDA